MMRLIYLFTTLSFFFLAPLNLQATHIVGGEMTYKCLGNNMYEIKLTIFRDCFYGSPAAWFDNPASIGVFNSSNAFMFQILVPLTSQNDTLNPDLGSPCFVVPPDVCVHTTTYTTTAMLPFQPGGYQLVYQRCCRNQTIANIINPLDVGATYSINLTEAALLQCNSSPQFNNWPPLYICVNYSLNIDQSATDIDGDSLVYKLCNPLTGANPGVPMPQPPNNPPYAPVPWVSPPYGVNNMLNGLPGGTPMAINPQTGLLTGIPNTIGQFVIGICIEEYRDGQLISVSRRDYQVNVGDCGNATASFLAPEELCDEYTVQFNNQSQNADNYQWYFDYPNNLAAASTLENPVYTYPGPGLYNVMLIAEPGEVCTDTFISQIRIYPNSLLPAFTIEQAACDGSLTINVLDSSTDTLTTIDSWNWQLVYGTTTLNSSQQNPSFTITEEGTATLTLTLTSANGCSKTLSQSFTIGFIDDPILPDTAICTGGSIELNPDGFVPGATYQWEPPQGLSDPASPNPTATINATITYSVTITSSDQLCSVTKEVTITALSSPVTSESITACAGDTVVIFGEDVTTPGEYTGVFTGADGCDSTHIVTLVVLDTLVTSETVEICQGSSVEIFGNLENMAGDYTMTFTGSNGCDSTHTVTLVVFETPATSETLQICFGDSVEIFGNFESVAGDYSMTFTATNGCDSTHIVTLLVGNEITLNLTATNACFGERNGSASATAAGGAGNYTFEWSAPSSGGNAVSDLAPGTYEVTVMDEDGCAKTASFTVGEFDEIIVNVNVQNVSCFGGSDGSATPNVTGGTGGAFSYQWSNGTSGTTLSGLTAGSYFLTVTDDGSGCTSVASITVNEPAQLSANVTGANISCAGNDGMAMVTASGGTTPYTYTWSNGGTGQSINGLAAGTYTATVTDANGCTSTASVTLTGEPGPTVAIVITNPVSKINPNGGALTAQITGGAAPVQIEWSTSATTASITGLSSGLYSVTVTDANGCTDVASQALFLPGCIGDRIWTDTNRNGCQDPGEFGKGSVKLTLTGTDIYGNSVSKMTTTSNNGQYKFDDLPPGTYQVKILTPANFAHSPMDACGSDFTDSDFNTSGVTANITLLEGQCNITVDGGLHDACLNVIDPGTICCDQTLCGPGVDPAPITSATPASGGVGTLQYMWMYSHDSPVFGAGTWFPVAGANGASYDPGPISQTTHFGRCVKTAGCNQWLESNIVTITVGNVAVADISGPDLVCVGKTGVYTAAANPAGATYFWNFGPWATPSNSIQPSVTVTWNQAGIAYITHTVTRNGCTSTDVMAVAISNSPVVCPNNFTGPTGGESNAEFMVYPNPANDFFVIQYNDVVESAVGLEIFSIDGKLLKNMKLSEGTYSHTIDLEGLLPGAYLLRMTYNEGERSMVRLIKS